MTTIRQNALHLIGSAVIAAVMLAGHSATVEARELCFEECTFELMGNCWRWKKACLNLTVSGKDAATENFSRSSRQQIPSGSDSILSGGLGTALGDGKAPNFGGVRAKDIMN